MTVNFFGVLIAPQEDLDSDHQCDICKLKAHTAYLAEIDLDGVPYWAHETCIVKLPPGSVRVIEWARDPDPYHNDTEEAPLTFERRRKIREEQIECPSTT